MPSMHLALVISSLGSGGAERVITELANYWAEAGHTVSLITLSGEGDAPFYPVDERVNLVRLDVMSSGEEGPLQRLWHIIRRIQRLRRAIKQLKPDRVLSFVDITNLTTLLACMRLGVPVIVSERTDPYFHVLPRFYIRLRRILYRWAESVVVQTPSAAAYFKGIPRVIEIPNSVQQIASHKAHKSCVGQIVSSGRLIPSKGFDELIKAFAKIVSQYTQAHLTIYGEGPERAHLEQMIAQYGLQDRVSMPGAVHNVVDCLESADLFVFPSHYEGFPNALAEAMALGLPVIASNCEGNAGLAQDGINARLFPVGNVEVLSSIMIELMEDATQRCRLSDAARLISQRFGSDNAMNLWSDVMMLDQENKNDA